MVRLFVRAGAVGLALAECGCITFQQHYALMDFGDGPGSSASGHGTLLVVTVAVFGGGILGGVAVWLVLKWRGKRRTAGVGSGSPTETAEVQGRTAGLVEQLTTPIPGAASTRSPEARS